jgi:hypothetical protein
MQKFIKLNSSERKNIIQKVANDLGLRFDIVEKDIWVCYVLQKLFSHVKLKNSLIFKGGTCLSKAYDKIERFSEDIDITINSEILDIKGDSQNTDKIKSKVRKAARKFVETEIFEYLSGIFDEELGKNNYELAFDESDKKHATLFFSFPSEAGFPYILPFKLENSYSYIKPKIKLEFGALGGISPTQEKLIKPYAKEILPDYFDEFEVVTLDIKRNFIEKLLILHSICFLEDDRSISQNYSRHYYDIHSIIKKGLKIDPTIDLEILKLVVENEKNYWKKPWVNYENINKFSDIRLIPNEARIAEIKKDYKNMEEMFFGDFPKFDEMMLFLKEFEKSLIKEK